MLAANEGRFSKIRGRTRLQAHLARIREHRDIAPKAQLALFYVILPCSSRDCAFLAVGRVSFSNPVLTEFAYCLDSCQFDGLFSVPAPLGISTRETQRGFFVGSAELESGSESVTAKSIRD